MNNIVFRDACFEDIDFITDLENHSDNRSFIIPWQKEQHIEGLKDLDFHYFILENQQSIKVGYCIITGLQNPHDNYELMRITIADKRKGYGRMTLRFLKKWVFEQKGAQRFWLDVKTHNVRAKKLYEAEGFVLEGTLRNCIKNGSQYESLHILSMLRSDYFSEQLNYKNRG